MPAIAVVAAGALVAGVVYAVLRASTSDPGRRLGPALDVAELGDRVLVIAPHPDDEVANPSGLIAAARARGAHVKVVLITIGDGYRKAAQALTTGTVEPSTFLELGRLRHAESEKALDEAGIPAEDRIYLAYADGSLNSLWDRDWDRARPHRGANSRRAIPYPFAMRPGASYCGENVAADLTSIIEDFRPTTIVYPDAEDQHHDHWATAAFTDFAMQRSGYRGLRLAYLTHFGLYPFPWAYLPDAYVVPPAPLESVGLRWHSLPLTRQQEKAKRREMGAFASQMRLPHMRVYLLAFVRRNELFCTFKPTEIAVSSSDEVPPDEGHRTQGVIREPVRRIAGFAEPRGTIREVRLVRGPTRLWMGIRTWDGAPADLAYHYGIRLFGDEARRIDVAVSGDEATAIRVSKTSIVPDSVRVARSDGTLWISFDAKIVEPYTSCMVAGRVEVPGTKLKPRRSAWRTMRL